MESTTGNSLINCIKLAKYICVWNSWTLSSSFLRRILPWFKLVRLTSHLQAINDWCCFYYFVRNSLVALLEALCARDNRDSALDHTVKQYKNCRNRRLPSPPSCFFQISPKNLDRLNFGIHIFVYVYKVHMRIYMPRGGMRSWTHCFFL